MQSWSPHGDGRSSEKDSSKQPNRSDRELAKQKSFGYGEHQR
jgi:hypothetical protein